MLAHKNTDAEEPETPFRIFWNLASFSASWKASWEDDLSLAPFFRNLLISIFSLGQNPT